jgi:hypothetical protein
LKTFDYSRWAGPGRGLLLIIVEPIIIIVIVISDHDEIKACPAAGADGRFGKVCPAEITLSCIVHRDDPFVLLLVMLGRPPLTRR